MWHHAAATYDGTTWRLYLDGVLEQQLFVGIFTPQSGSIQHAAIGSALNSTGGIGSQTQGFFGGALDEVRIWNVARSAAQILSGKDQEIPTATGLLGRWGFNESCGGVRDSSGNNQHGTLSGANCTFVAGAPFTSTPNTAPVVNAGADLGVALPAGAALSGTATDDGLPGTGLTTTWSKVSGLGTVTFGNASALNTSATFSLAGTYVLRLTATDGLLSTFDELTIVATGALNLAPVVNAGPDQTIALPINQVSLTGTATDDGLPGLGITTTWSKVSGPGTVTFGDPGILATTATFSLQGTYVLQLAASDGLLSSSDTMSVTVSPNAADGAAIDFGGTNAYVTFGAAPGLGASTFTIETWFKRDGAGIATNTGTGGVVAVPLIAKGMAEAEGGTVDMNYFLGIRGTDNVLVADFEDTATGLNHPVAGTTAIPSDGVWRHAAATYDGTTWRLYLDGALQAQLVVGAFTPQFNSIQHATLGTALNSTGGIGSQTQGFFNGALDEARVWSYARSAQQISRGAQLEIASAPGLKGRWSFSETAGTTVADSSGNSITGTIVGTNWTRVSGAPFTGTNATPVAADDAATTPESTAVTIAVLANDTDGDSDPLALTTVGTPAHGTASVNPNGTVTYTPAAAFNGSDSFTYAMTDSQGGSANATVDVTISSVNESPVAVNDSYSTSKNIALTVDAPGGVLANDTDGDGDLLMAFVLTDPSHGTLTLNAEGDFTYTPATGYAGPDSFTYVIDDGVATSNVATVAITVTPTNDPPVAQSDSYSTDEDTPLVVAAPGVLNNDTDPNSNPLTAVLVAGAGHGSVTVNPNGGFTYTPAANYNGPDSFTYKANDGLADSNVVTVGLTVNAVNDAPVAGNDAFAGNEDATLVVSAPGLLANDADSVEGSALTAVLVTGPDHGTLTLNSDGSFSYAPAANFSGSDTFTYRASDGGATSAIATATLIIAAMPDAPVAQNDSYTTTEDTTLVTFGPSVLANDSDVDGQPLTAILVSGPSNGTLTLNANGGFSYTPDVSFSGLDSFTYKANDGFGDSNVATVSITVNAVNDIPVAGNNTYSTNEDVTLVVNVPGVLGNDSDGDGNPLSVIVVSGPAHGTLLMDAERRVHVCARGQLQRAGQLHLPGLRRHRQLEPRDGDDYGQRGERPTRGRARQLQHERGHASGRRRSRIEGE